MSISIGSEWLTGQLQSANKTTKADSLQNKLGSVEDATDEELMDVCKEFEAYLVEQVFKKVRDAMTDEESNKGDYMQYFGDTLYQEYAKNIAENGDIGLAKQLYESMKRDIKSLQIRKTIQIYVQLLTAPNKQFTGMCEVLSGEFKE